MYDKIGIVIVTFNSERVIKKTIEAALKQNVRIVIVDNASKDHTLDIVSLYTNIHVISFDENKGIAAALNAGIIYLQQYCEWALTLDHDTTLPENYIQVFVDNYLHQKNIYASYSPRIIDVKAQQYLSLDTPHPVMCYTSGNIINISTWDTVGRFNEKLFIDSVDTEFCLRLKSFKQKICLMKELTMSHSLGDSCLTLNFILLKKTVYFHSDFRNYYITRNYTYMIKKYFSENARYFVKGIVGFILDFIVICIYYRKNSVRPFFKGFIDGLRGSIQ